MPFTSREKGSELPLPLTGTETINKHSPILLRILWSELPLPLTGTETYEDEKRNVPNVFLSELPLPLTGTETYVSNDGRQTGMSVRITSTPHGDGN